MRLTPEEIEHIERTGSYENGQRTISMHHFKALVETAMVAARSRSREDSPWATMQRLIQERQDASRPGVFEIDPRPPIERYLRAEVLINGGCISAALSRERGEPLRELRALFQQQLRDESARILAGAALDDENGGPLSDALDDMMQRVWPARCWWGELWLTGADEEPLTQFYAPWGRPRWR